MADKNVSEVPPIVADTTILNPAVLGDPPFVATITGNLFQATAQALSNAAHNATNSQQDAWITMQAATAQAISTLLSIDTASSGVGTEHAYAVQPSPTDSSKGDYAVEALTRHHAAEAQSDIELSNGEIVDNFARAASEVGHDARLIIEAFAASLERLDDCTHRRLLSAVKLSATANCLAEMIKYPEKIEHYEQVLAAIRNLR